ncbi:SAM-dependent methyltransferase [Terrihabitans soli]|uniref:SAM-dependent methyltransferase n=1 Tax=Terrihabitans soli TaxID=708113 RepID=A0A6S6QXE8_9HYPH|nr:methyltransferase domain-containing protein [Terrihabitans soli]BCJ91228.1 SAM-dependent methyltransferase [Terrihabitans soli]
MDIFGNALRDRQAGLGGRLMTIRRDDGHTDAHDPDLYFAAEPFPHEIDLLKRAEGPILDVGCGAGRTLLWLQGRGFQTTGIDKSRGAVEVCLERECQDVRLFDIMDGGPDALGALAFQTAVLFGNNFGIGGTIEGGAELLRRLTRVLAPGGQILVTGLDITGTTDPSHLAYHQRNRARNRPCGEIVMRFEYEDDVGEWTQWFHPEAEELVRLAAEANLSVEAIGPAGGPFYAAALRTPR